MPPRFCRLWILVLAALFAGSMAEARRGDVWSGEATLRGIDSPSSAVGYALPIVRSLPALKTRSPIDRHAPFGVALSHTPTAIFSRKLLLPEPKRDPAQAQESSRHFPLFPTGPPSHN